ncbi:MAG: oligosaccharide flippase family protein [Patescibacteria group bacterium]
MNEADIAIIKKKSLSGIVALTSRTFVLQLVAFGATFLLTIFLTPSIFGIFYVVSAIISFLGYFSDIGLAAALIQKKEELTDEDLATTFSIQQILIGIMVIVSLFFSSAVAQFYRLDSSGIWLFRALVISFFLSSLKTIPSVILERKLDFQKLVVPQIAETIGFYAVAVVLAWQGLGVTSFTWAVLVRGVMGLIVMYIVCPWRISLGISPTVAKRLIKFGLPFQTNSLLALVKDDLLTVFLGKMLPFAEIGYIGWAKKWAEVPLRLLMDSVMRVTFPAFSRIQQSKEALGRAIEKTLFGLSLTIFPISTALLFFVLPLIHVVPRYGKWEPAVFSFYLFTIASAVASLSTPLTNALNAIGKIKITLSLMVFWTASTWALTVLFVWLFGYNGVAVALLIISSTLWLVVTLVKRVAPFSFWKSVGSALIGAIGQGLIYGSFLAIFPHGIAGYVAIALAGAILYGGILWMLEGERIRKLITSFREAR